MNRRGLSGALRRLLARNSAAARQDGGDAALVEPPTTSELFLAFAGISALGFGGVLPWARRGLVERRTWLTPDAFNEALSLAQLLPGGNIINLGIIVGQRFRGPAGALACASGLLAAPALVVVLLANLYGRYGHIPAVERGVRGLAAAAAGLVLAMAAKMSAPLLRGKAGVPLVVAGAVFVAVALLRLPLVLVLIVAAPASVALAWRKPL